MNITELIAGLPVGLAQGSPRIEIRSVVEDSRSVTPGCLFIARQGTKSDGRQYIADAVNAGAAAVLADDVKFIPPNAAALVCNDVPVVSALIAERFYGHPTKTLKLIGITGTNGKTTTAYLIRHLLNESGRLCGMVGTVQIDDGTDTFAADLTTPPAIALSKLMRSMLDNGCQACVMEASSHAIHQKRIAGLNFHIGVFTNLTGDHLDYHGSMDDYRAAKAMLFDSLPSDGFAVLNMDDPSAEAMARHCRCTIITCSAQDATAMCFVEIGDQTLSFTEATFRGPWGAFTCRLPLIGKHNAVNALHALVACWAMGLNESDLRSGLASCAAPPGRLEPVTTPDHEFAVLVDYAHTDDALENVLRALRPIVSSRRSGGKLRVVFGCGGDRDRTKRPRMAGVACRWADEVIITSDNPRTEGPQAIIDEICRGVPADRLDDVACLADRAQAIQAAVERTGPGDVLLIAGKGHEDYQIIGTTKRPFDDRKVAYQALIDRMVKAPIA